MGSPDWPILQSFDHELAQRRAGDHDRTILMNSVARFGGIDFSGDISQWGPGCTRSNVWLAEAELDSEGKLNLLDLRRVQGLPGTARPFERLANYIRGSALAAVAIDAPFSVPAEYVPDGSHKILLERAAKLERGNHHAPFSSGAELLRALLPGIDNTRGLKVYRKTEHHWRGRGVQVRSTLWNGPRGGAPFTAACLTLLRSTALPIWPWCTLPEISTRRPDVGVAPFLVEAFPAAQLCKWQLPFAGYGRNDPNQRPNRAKILEGLKNRHNLTLSEEHAELMVSVPDALDAVVCIYAAKAASECQRRWPEHHHVFKEGLIGVHP